MMKKNTFKKIAATVLSGLMVFSLFACSPAQMSDNPKNGAKKIVAVNKDMYAPTGAVQAFDVAYYENEEEVLLVEVDYAIEQLLKEAVFEMTGSSATVEEDATKVTLTRDNGAVCEMDFVKDTVYFSDYDKFNMKGYAATPHDLLAMPYLNEAGESVYFERRDSFYTPGYAIEIDLAERDIPMDIYQGKKYIPLQTFNDIFVSQHGLNVAYNGEKLFVLVGNTVSEEIAPLYYGKQASLRSDALTKFNYDELCLFMDLHYGLQAEHGFDNGFTYYLDNIGLKDEFLKNDAVYSYVALGTLTMGYIADLHSVVTGASPYVGTPKPSEEEEIIPSAAFIDYVQTNAAYKNARASVYPSGVGLWEKVDNTAYVTFDEFSLAGKTGDYETDLAQGPQDTIDYISAVHMAILQNPDIENVVVDLSCNGGGAVDAAVYMVAWMLGYCDVSVYNTVTESSATTTYKADVNRDGVFDEKDTIADKNLYCLVSPVSFSCGNYVPALLKASGKVTIVGKTTTGGACIVRHGVTADGTIFQISSTNRLSTVKNGSYYSVDQGVTPDITLTKMASFYDRSGLTDYLNGLR